jgi:hypothetical protein
MHRILMALCVSATWALAADKLTAPQLIDLVRTNPAKLQEAILATLGHERIHNGTALIGRGPDFIWAVESASRPVLMVDDAPGPAMQKLGTANIWYAVGKLTAGTGHEFEYRIDGKPFGGSKDVSAFGPES